jgi:hypothetical protein
VTLVVIDRDGPGDHARIQREPMTGKLDGGLEKIRRTDLLPARFHLTDSRATTFSFCLTVRWLLAPLLREPVATPDSEIHFWLV